MRRHYSSYFKGFPNIKPYREKLVTTYDVAEILAILDEIQDVYTRELELEHAA
jgi:tRNA-dihydrouridine synthase B